jgi:hypothetical protein
MHACFQAAATAGATTHKEAFKHFPNAGTYTRSTFSMSNKAYQNADRDKLRASIDAGRTREGEWSHFVKEERNRNKTNVSASQDVIEIE